MQMTAETRYEMNVGCDPSMTPALRRALVFLLLGPILGVSAVLLAAAMYGGMGPFIGLIVGMVFVLGLQIGGITALADGILSRILPVFLRVPLTAVTGAMIGIGALTAILGPLSQDMLPIGGTIAFCAAVCSLLSHDYRAEA